VYGYQTALHHHQKFLLGGSQGEGQGHGGSFPLPFLPLGCCPWCQLRVKNRNCDIEDAICKAATVLQKHEHIIVSYCEIQIPVSWPLWANTKSTVEQSEKQNLLFTMDTKIFYFVEWNRLVFWRTFIRWLVTLQNKIRIRNINFITLYYKINNVILVPQIQICDIKCSTCPDRVGSKLLSKLLSSALSIKNIMDQCYTKSLLSHSLTHNRHAKKHYSALLCDKIKAGIQQFVLFYFKIYNNRKVAYWQHKMSL